MLIFKPDHPMTKIVEERFVSVRVVFSQRKNSPLRIYGRKRFQKPRATVPGGNNIPGDTGLPGIVEVQYG